MFTRNSNKAIVFALAAGLLCSAPLSVFAEKKGKAVLKEVVKDGEEAAKAADSDIETIYSAAGQTTTGNTRTRTLEDAMKNKPRDGASGGGKPPTGRIADDKRYSKHEQKGGAVVDEGAMAGEAANKDADGKGQVDEEGDSLGEAAKKDTAGKNKDYSCKAENLQYSKKDFITWTTPGIEDEIFKEYKKLNVCADYIYPNCKKISNQTVEECKQEIKNAKIACSNSAKKKIKKWIKMLEEESNRRLCCDSPKPQPGCSWPHSP